MAIAASLELYFGRGFGRVIEHPATIVSGLWSVMAAVVVMQSRLGGTYKAVWTRFLGILIGSVAGGVFIGYFGDGALSICIGVFLTVSMCSLLNLKDSIRIAGLSTALIIILGGARPGENPWAFTLFRFMDSCIGMMVSLSVAYFLWPEKALENMRQTTVRVLGSLGKYYRSATPVEKKSETVAKGMAALHVDIADMIEENRTYCTESEMELFDRDNLHEHWKVLVMQLESLFEMITTLGKVNHETMALIIDDGLSKAIGKVVDETDIIIQNMEKELSGSSQQGQPHGLAESLKSLNEELLRFRQTRATRKFSLEDVESFFVYFYSLKTIGEEVLKMEQTVETM